MLMSMDVATLTHALSPELVKSNLHERYQMITSPSDSCREEAMRYVDTFVKVFYYPDEVRICFPLFAFLFEIFGQCII